MDTVLITRECLAGESEIASPLATLKDLGAHVYLVGPDPGDAQPVPAGVQVLAAAREGNGSAATALQRALREPTASTPDNVIVLTAVPEAAKVAEDSGCRVMLVLDDRPLSSMLDLARERGVVLSKQLSAAPNLATALHYAAAEAQEAQRLGPSPFGAPRGATRDWAPIPTTGDLARVMGLVVLAGTAIALAIAYFLQEIYQTFRFPGFVYWLTLQFLPDWGRGILFLLFGVAIGVLASRALSGVSTRRGRRT